MQHLQQLVTIADHRGQGCRFIDDELALVTFQPHRQRLADIGDDGTEIEPHDRTDMLVELDPRQGQQVIDQARHARRLARHDVQKAPSRRFIFGCRTLQRLDEAR